MSDTLAALLLMVIAATLSTPAWSEPPLRDPTRPGFAQPSRPANETAFQVTAIFVSESRRLAIVNGETVAEGDEIEGALVTEILPGAVSLRYRGRTITTELLSASWRRER